MKIKSSHELYVILNSNGTLFVDKNKDFRLYKTKKGLEKHKEKYVGKQVAVFELTNVIEMEKFFTE